MNLQEEMLKIKNEMIDEFDKRVEALKVEEQGFPQSGERYWSINGGGIVNSCFWKSEQFDLNRYRIGNTFKTEKEAEIAVEKLKVEAELRKFSRPFEYGKFNYHLFFDIDGNSFRTAFTSYCPPQGTIHFESDKKARQAIDTVGEDRIKKYIFGVES